MKIGLLAITTILILNSQGQNTMTFQGLTKISIDSLYDSYFYYDIKSSRLINKSCRLLDNKDRFYCSDSIPIDGYLVAKYKCSNLTDSIYILFDGGLSDDPEFSFYNEAGKLLKGISANSLFLNSFGTAYLTGHSNCMYDRKRKFQISNDTIIETHQPFYYVGIKGKVKKEITLFANRTGDEIVVKIPKNYDIEILLAESTTKDYDIDKLFLVKTQFGLIGWLRIDEVGLYEEIIDGLFYDGD
jgi:hypothetical protein